MKKIYLLFLLLILKENHKKIKVSINVPQASCRRC